MSRTGRQAISDGRTKQAERSGKRTEILGAASELFAAKGYTGTSMRDIASATGMLAGSLYYHFESKEALAATMVADLRDDILAATQQEADPSDTPIEALRRFANAVADASARHPVRCRCASVSRRPRIRSWRRCWRPNHGGRTASGRHW
ncbi:TetR family transcriptional regulator [Rhodococcus hoagii]|nr:TetR family transcriptional regulator [Prescottella equi]MBM4717783.1 TetR family transcriptional regulator [Prescottella equi]